MRRKYKKILYYSLKRCSIYGVTCRERDGGRYLENGFLTVEQAAEKWGISKRRVQKLCADGRVPFAQRFGKSWAIPIEAPKPEDGRTCKKSATDSTLAK